MELIDPDVWGLMFKALIRALVVCIWILFCCVIREEIKKWRERETTSKQEKCGQTSDKT